MMDITAILTTIITLLTAIVTGIVIPLIKAKTTTAQWDNVVAWTTTAVQAAEVIYKGAGRGEEKRDYVLSYISGMCATHNVIYDEVSVRNALEQAWLTLTKAS